ncbi:signal peptide peptidase SppA [Methyloferula stellata]|uniref:signal peptide peptidase SppA n=1 Tax=Methyloferula stellata TaxID=876270 RepID=UPI0003670C8A|nr:signal peptide peptidase SppA [Methyloferula stellata]
MASLPPSDYLVDRRQLRRKLSFWRVAAILCLIVAVVVAGTRLIGTNAGKFTPHIARLSISGLITGDRKTLTLIHDIGEAKNVSAVLVSIESPGGTTTGAERLYDALRKLSAKKPTVAVVGTLAASGGYIAAIGTDEIFSRGNSIVGSIGVLVQYPNVAKLLDKIGVSVEAIKSSPLKASPDGYEPTSPEARAAIASLVNDSFEWFKALVKERRKMSDQELAAVDDGRIFTGRQGIGLKLVDKIGGEQEAVTWLEQERGIHKGLPIRDWTANKSLGSLGILGVSARLAEWSGFSELSRTLDYGQSLSDTRLLDGLVSIWQFDSPQGN